MRSGERIEQRFVLESVAGRGGMGEVWRALDEKTGLPCAVKLMRAAPELGPRFVREAEVLAALNHPHVVRYLHHGVHGDQPYIAMEWLEGEDLAKRLSRGRLPMDTALDMVWRIASGLAPAHDRGVVHRDLKPTNLFLAAGDPLDVRILDFGVARVLDASLALTNSGYAVGTPAYSSPEQARGEQGVDARTDVFAMGVVLFEALTGRRAYGGVRPSAVLAKLLLAPPPRLRDVASDLPEVVEDLVHRMLAGSPEERPRDAHAVMREIERVRELGPVLVADEQNLAGERKVVSVLVAGGVKLPPTVPSAPAARVSAHPLVRSGRARVETLSDGMQVYLLEGGGDIVERAEVAAQAALELAASGQPVALATGWTRVGFGAPEGDLIERALELLDTGEGGAVRLDDVSARLVGARFSVEVGDVGFVLHQEHEVSSVGVRDELPLVGRDRELERLLDLAGEAFENRAPRVIMISGVPGIGKSRLARELVGRSTELEPDLSVWFARGDSMRRGVPRLLLRQLAARALGGPLTAHHDPAHETLVKWVGEARAAEIAPDLRNLFDAEGGFEGEPELAERRLAEAFVEFATAITRVGPLLIVIEDLQHGDLASLRMLQALVQERRGLPVVILCAGRPEVRSVLPLLEADWELTVRRLARLTPAAARDLARAALGASANEKMLERIVAWGEGIPLRLLELCSSASASAEGGGGPPTIASLFSERLQRLDAMTRRVVRAGTIFGEEFPVAGVQVLLGGLVDGVDRALALLVQADVIEPSEEPECYRFCQRSLRDAAYASLEPQDRIRSHGMVAEYLVDQSEGDASVVAEHLLRAGHAKQAGRYFLRAASDAAEANDPQAAAEFATRAVSVGVSGRPQLNALLLAARSYYILGDLGRASETAKAVSEHCGEDEPEYWSALALEIMTRVLLGAPVDSLVHRLASVPAAVLQANVLVGHRVVAASSVLALAGRRGLSPDAIGRVEAVLDGRDDEAAQRDRQWLAASAAQERGDLGAALSLLEAIIETSTRAGDFFRAGTVSLWRGRTARAAGATAESLESFRGAVVLAARSRNGFTISFAEVELARLQLERGEIVEGLDRVEAVAERLRVRGAGPFVGQLTQLVRALGLEASGRLEEAHSTLRPPGDRPEPVWTPFRPLLLASLLRLERSLGLPPTLGPAQIREEIERIQGRTAEGETELRLEEVAALVAAGREGAAQGAQAAALSRLKWRAARIEDRDLRRAFLGATSARRKTLAPTA